MTGVAIIMYISRDVIMAKAIALTAIKHGSLKKLASNAVEFTDYIRRKSILFVMSVLEKNRVFAVVKMLTSMV